MNETTCEFKQLKSTILELIVLECNNLFIYKTDHISLNAYKPEMCSQ